jgi:4-hydroxy-tetrahydrodipicolinate synthase
MPRFSGVIPPLVTPLSAHDKLDVEAVDRVVDHVISGGVSGVFVLGTTGEGPSLSYRTRYEVVERACSTAEGRVPVLVCVTDSSLAESLYLAEHAASCVATAIVAAAPFYYPVSQSALIRWFQQLADESALPLMLYNMPGCVRVNLDMDTVVTLSRHPNIVGIKDSSGDMEYFGQLCTQFAGQKGFSVMMGPEERLSDAVAAGANGGVCGGANLLPELYVNLYKAAVKGDAAEVTRLNQVVEMVFSTIYRDANGQMNLIPALKQAMSHCGLCSEVVAPPLYVVESDHRKQIADGLSELMTAAGSLATMQPNA